MENLDRLLKKIEENYENKDKKEITHLTVGENTYEVLLLSRSEKSNLIFSADSRLDTTKAVYKWLKPVIYRSLQLQEVALKAKEAGYINDYYGICDLLFEPDEIFKIIKFLIEANHLDKTGIEELEFQKK